ncbi:MAG: hypothetical protein ACTSPV_08610 [Candidatus Hodarchaeales archaeon]
MTEAEVWKNFSVLAKKFLDKFEHITEDDLPFLSRHFTKKHDIEKAGVRVRKILGKKALKWKRHI